MQNNSTPPAFAYGEVMLSIARIYVSPGHNFFGRHGEPPGEHPTLSVPEVECFAGRGLTGDRFFAWETYEDLCRQFAVTDKDPGVFRRNVITLGADLNALIGKEFEVQGITFFGTQESAPCEWMDTAFAPGAKNAMKGRGGLRARILTDGILRVNDREE
jgi:hypothetical protein